MDSCGPELDVESSRTDSVEWILDDNGSVLSGEEEVESMEEPFRVEEFVAGHESGLGKSGLVFCTGNVVEGRSPKTS